MSGHGRITPSGLSPSLATSMMVGSPPPSTSSSASVYRAVKPAALSALWAWTSRAGLPRVHAKNWSTAFSTPPPATPGKIGEPVMNCCCTPTAAVRQASEMNTTWGTLQ